MSEPTVTQPPPRPGPAGSQSKLFGMNRTTVIVAAAAFIGAVAWFWWKRKGQQQSSASGTGVSTGSCTDANGNPVPCTQMAGIDYSGQLSTVQTELESISAAEANEPVPPPGPQGPQGPAGPAGTATVQQVAQYSAPGGVRAMKQAPGVMAVVWNLGGQPQPNPTSYTIAVYQLNGKLAAQQTVSVPDQTGGTSGATVSGLHTGWCYHANVWANGGKTAPNHTTANGGAPVCV